MKRTLALAALLFLAAADRRAPLLGHWTGTSTCTAVRPACHDEIASYYVKPSPSKDVVGKDVLMGTSDFRIDFATHVLTSVVEGNGQRSVWSFTWSGDTMTGTAKQSDGQIIRNIRLTKQPK